MGMGLPCSPAPLSWNLACSPTWKLTEPSAFEFTETSSHKYGWLNHWQLNLLWLTSLPSLDGQQSAPGTFSQFSSVTQSCPTLWDPMNRSMPGFPVHHQLPEFTQTHAHRDGDAIQPSHLLSSPSPPAPNPSQHQGLFQWINSSHEVAKVLEFHFSISPSNEHPGLISFRVDWLDLLPVQGTLKSLLQHHSSKPSILHSAFFTVQFSHPYTTTGKTIALTRWTFFAKMGTTKDKWYGPNRSRRY